MRPCFACLIVLLLSAAARAQSVFGGGVTAFDPEIKVLNSGALLDAQVVVSKDMKYVTITARPSVAQIVALRQFSFMPIPNGLGNVGSLAIQELAEREKGRPARAAVPVPSVMDRRGITKLD